VLAGLSRASATELPEGFSRPEGDGAYDRVYRYHGDLSGERIRSLPVEAEPSLTTDLVGLISSERGVAVAARVEYDVGAGPGPLEYRVELPAGWTVRSVNGSRPHSWRIERGEGPGERLVVAFRERASTGTLLDWFADRVGPDVDVTAAVGLTVRFPSFRAAGEAGARELSRWRLAASDDLDLGLEPATTLLAIAPESAARWLTLPDGHSERMALRSLRADSVLEVTATARRSRVRSLSTTAFRVAALHVDVASRFRLRIENAGAQSFSFRLPAEATFVEVSAAGTSIRREVVRDAGAIRVNALLPSPLVGEVPVEIFYRLPRPAGRGPIALRAPELLDVEATEAYLALLRRTTSRFEVLSESGLAPVSPDRLVDLPALGAAAQEEGDGASGEVSAWRAYLRLERGAELVVEEAEASTTVSEDVVELAELDTVLAADGRNWTVATYTVRNLSRQFLEFELPPAHELWRVTVDGTPVAVSERARQEPASDRVLVPVEPRLETDLALRVSLVYTLPRAELPARVARFAPRAPRLVGFDSAKTLETFWRIHIPEGYDLSAVEGNLEAVIESAHHGTRVRGLVSEIQRLEAAGESANRRGRERARKNLLQLEQALEDRIAEIDEAGKGPAGVLLDLGSEDLARQVRESVESAQVGRQILEGRRQTEPEGEEAAALLDPVDQEFDQAQAFSRGRWREDAKEDGAEPERRSANAIEALDQTLAPPPAPASPPTPGGAAQRATQGLPEDPSGRAAPRRPLFQRDLPLEIAVPDGGKVHTLRRLEGNPEVEITLVSARHHGRWLHLAGLVVTLAACGYFWFWRRRKPAGAP
jgi:hypothetical protein